MNNHGDKLKYLIFSGNKRSIELIKATEFRRGSRKLAF